MTISNNFNLEASQQLQKLINNNDFNFNPEFYQQIKILLDNHADFTLVDRHNNSLLLLA